MVRAAAEPGDLALASREPGLGNQAARGRWLALSGAALSAMVLPALFEPSPRLVWNVSGSAPKGLYWVSPAARPSVGDYAAARLPPAVERLAAERHYLPAGIPLIKQVAAVPGDEICGSAQGVTVFGRPVAARRPRDPAGRRMPWWTGCRRLGAGEYLLVNPANPLSFDGRYFGPTQPSAMLGQATLIWAL